jgi:hypothetical protein
MRELPVILTAAAAVAFFTLPALAELGSDNPTDAALLTQREVEAGCDTSTTPPTCPSGTTCQRGCSARCPCSERFRELSAEDQQAVIEFLKQL